MKYDVVYLNETSSYPPRAIERLGPFETIEEAKESRKVSGHLVVHSGTVNVVQDNSWLWDWERKDPRCYAMRKIAERSVTP